MCNGAAAASCKRFHSLRECFERLPLHVLAKLQTTVSFASEYSMISVHKLLLFIIPIFF